MDRMNTPCRQQSLKNQSGGKDLVAAAANDEPDNYQLQ
jgi:hypothetical protein